MGNDCRRVGSDAFICTGGCSCVHPVIIVTQQTLASVTQQSHLPRHPVLRCRNPRGRVVSASGANVGVPTSLPRAAVVGVIFCLLTSGEPRAKPRPQLPSLGSPGEGWGLYMWTCFLFTHLGNTAQSPIAPYSHPATAQVYPSMMV